MNQNPRAWLLRDSAHHAFAVSEIEMVAYDQSPLTYRVPASPLYCPELILWQQRLIPLLHMALLFEPHARGDNTHIGIFAYQTGSGSALDYLALSLNGAPQKIEVTENTVATLPHHYNDPLLRPLAISCFSHQGESVPILDISYLASATMRDNLHDRAAA